MSNLQVRNEPFPIQLAIQGGGAKICSLLAALEAVQELESKNVIKIKRIAGTSAGAIVGSLFAAGVDLKAVRKHLRQYSGKQLAKLFPPPSTFRVVRKLRSGRPLWDTNRLASELNEFFKEQRVFKLGDTRKNGVEMIIVAANLGESSKVVYSDPDKDLVPALLDSCGLPFCFRVWNKDDNPVIVDGGICDNLPSEELEPFQAEDGPVLGISFLPTIGKSPNGFKEFSVALLNTAINNSMNRARRRLGSDRVFSINTEIGTFDFARAITDGLNAEYDVIKNDARVFFSGFADASIQKKISSEKTKEIVGKGVWFEQSISIMEKLNSIYKSQHLVNKLSYKYCSVVVQANTMVEDEDSDFYGAEDYVSYSMKFETGEEPIYCHGFNLSVNPQSSAPDESEITLWNHKSNCLNEIVSTPMRDPGQPQKKQLLISFIPVLPSRSGPYTLRCKDVVKDFMSDLKSKRRDFLEIMPLRAAGTIGRIDLVLHLPVSLTNVDLYPPTGTAGGSKMKMEELDTRYPPPPKFRAYGWTVMNWDPSTQFRVDIFV